MDGSNFINYIRIDDDRWQRLECQDQSCCVVREISELTIHGTLATKELCSDHVNFELILLHIENFIIYKNKTILHLCVRPPNNVSRKTY